MEALENSSVGGGGARGAEVGFDVEGVRGDFPILGIQENGRPLVYLDNAATTQKPRAVIDAIVRYYETQNANIHRGVYGLSQRATGLFEESREKVRRFINAREAAEIIFTRGTTEGINLVANSWGRANLGGGDVVVVSHMEHHSDIVPWQMVCEAVGGRGGAGARVRAIPINEAGELELRTLEEVLRGGGVKMVAVNHVSNSLGTINPVEEIVRMAHAHGALVLIDGAQWVAHGRTDVQKLGADFYVFSGHKLYGPTGIGVLYGRRELLEAMPPWQGGGDMIASVTFEKTEYAGLPNKFEAGTPDIAGAVGLGAAIDYIEFVGLERIGAYEGELLKYATERLRGVKGLRIIGTAARKAGVISFVLESPTVSSLDIGMALDREGICVRTGHHCCQPVMDRYGVGSTARASFAFYNTRGEVDALVGGLEGIVAGKTEGRSQKSVVSSQKGGGGGIEYPGAFAGTPEEAAGKLAEEFEFLGERDAKNEYVLDLAKGLPRLFEMLKRVTERVPGCMSQVYLVGRRKPGSGDVFEFVADSDAEIVRGLIVILQRVYSGQRAEAVLGFDIEGFFRRIGLDNFITAQRRNGLAGMIGKIRGLAGEIVNSK
ncbi:MAG TPA: SufS family cysteine desulfurase [Phycisphaerae bacterium]|nr:SufS family cysteine desulfurase [Phycisphaerae bacterium]